MILIRTVRPSELYTPLVTGSQHRQRSTEFIIVDQPIQLRCEPKPIVLATHVWSVVWIATAP